MTDFELDAIGLVIFGCLVVLSLFIWAPVLSAIPLAH
jgi:hypothetical protein